MFEEMPFRLPSEAEHEYAHRGLKPSTLSWRGDEVPGEAWMQDAQQQRANAFGLCRFGLYPEVTIEVPRGTCRFRPRSTRFSPKVLLTFSSLIIPKRRSP